MATTEPKTKTHNIWAGLKEAEWRHIKHAAELELIRINISTTLEEVDRCNLVRLLRENGYTGEADVLEAAQEVAQ
jgi:lipid II:glycine glycyltransferase (peptidoglycan interpeptide bridge formation enzyme)